VKLTLDFFGIGGPMLVGKSTMAEMLSSHYKNSFIIPFAKDVKEFASQMGWNGEKDDKGRRLLQLLGTDCMRDCIDMDGWLKLWFGRVAEAIGTTLLTGIADGKFDNMTIAVIADDLRFMNELRLINNLGGTTILLKSTRQQTATGIIGHRSEIGLPSTAFSCVIDNSGTRERLASAARRVNINV